GTVTVDGPGSTWEISDYLRVGYYGGSGILEINNGGLVSVGGVLWIDRANDKDDFINMATRGMLALYGEADDSLTDFLDLIKGTDDIRYWNDDAWAPITAATPGSDYTLEYVQNS
ncbi:MAG: hypothetical protein QGH33_15035, partial [Pirellulaceae bacterium]|nr:hypothetical protein [Pirellulaceae bacterium]